ncbi:CoA-transferase family III [Dentipellis sp. KUC8613]|nr:CoA-transferase family III [Dentipellis sp. KUC8613]
MSPPLASRGPLHGVKVVEFAGLAPGPFAGLILADFGATVIRIDRHSLAAPNPFAVATISRDILCRSKRSIALDIKSPEGLELARRLIRDADVLIDPFRPGVLERVGLGPETWLGGADGRGGENPKLVYARIAGFRRDGPHRDMAGHDINYLSLSGILSLLPGTAEKPVFPLNLLADFAGGGLTCALGVLLALFERAQSGHGQVVDTDMVSGTRYVSTFPLLHAALRTNLFATPASPRQSNLLDGGAPFYSVYTCADGKFMAVGCLEPQFFRVFLQAFLRNVPRKWLDKEKWVPDAEVQGRREEWAALRSFLERGFQQKGRDEWAAIFDGIDACATPVLSPEEAAVLASKASASPPSRPFLIPSPAPHLSRTPAPSSFAPVELLQPGQHTKEILLEAGLSMATITRLAREGIIGVGDGLDRAKL